MKVFRKMILQYLKGMITNKPHETSNNVINFLQGIVKNSGRQLPADFFLTIVYHYAEIVTTYSSAVG